MPFRSALVRMTASILPLAVLGACGQPAQREEPGADLARFYDQELSFGPCADYATNVAEEKAYASDAFQCARLEVPLDYDDPGGRTARIAVLRVPARGEPIGSLLLNPGGPGGPGLAMAVAMSRTLATSAVTERFDLVGFDPRGVGASTPALDCATDDERDRGDALVPAVGEWSAEDGRELVRTCAERSGGADVLAHVGTRDAVRDMDVLRAVLGDEKVSFLGQSYGTRLGAVYAEEFPEKVRAMVLDGAVDPKLGTVERRLTQFEGFQRAFDKMAADCATRPGCPLGTDPAGATGTFQGIVRPLIDKPVPVSDGRELTYSGAINAVTAGLYDSSAWQTITQGLTEVLAGRGDILTALDDSFGGRAADGRWSNYLEANFAINCMDEQRRTPGQEADLQRRLHETAPFGDPGQELKGARDGCEFWPARPTLDYPYATGVENLPGTLTISVTGDPSTPFEAGQSLADTLGGVLLTVEGEQHTVALSGKSPCVNDIVADYLVDLKLPASGARCGAG
ncbi:alpha/beta hydrolase [Actinophytocola oryzae]|uniref:Alpha/beta hydrolase family protein n=1 Tax=Actinophytocola oryzae TaxID=502181 RepID=A0A4R7W1F3_9PSEU|nr:alpha/beta hydrolase [Actinophytocola oryzae]TDV56390.1 alpha/beta hydrolase family protein [Actinophytocola oryzae]